MLAPNPDKLIEAYSRISSTNQRTLDTLTHVLTLFHAQDIDCILLKGADLLSRLYGVRGIRSMVDADLLVREQDLPAIDRIVRGLGFIPQIDGNPAYRDPERLLLLDMITEVWYSNDVEGIWQRAMQRTVAGLPVKGMGTDDLLIYLAAYSVLHRGYFPSSFSKDIALLAVKETLDWGVIVGEALRWNLKVPLYHGLSYASRHETVSIPDHVLRSLAPVRMMEKAWLAVLQKLVTDQPLDDVGQLLMLIALPWDMTWRRLKQIFWPSPTFLNYRYGLRGASVPVRTRLARALHLTMQAHRLAVRILYRLAWQY